MKQCFRKSSLFLDSQFGSLWVFFIRQWHIWPSLKVCWFYWPECVCPQTKAGAVHTSGNRMPCFLCTDHSFWSNGELINYAILLGTGITKGIRRGPVLTELKSSHGRSEQGGLAWLRRAEAATGQSGADICFGVGEQWGEGGNEDQRGQALPGGWWGWHTCIPAKWHTWEFRPDLMLPSVCLFHRAGHSHREWNTASKMLATN